MPSGIDERAPRPRGGESQRVVDQATTSLVVAREPRKDRQACRVRRRPACGAHLVRTQTPGRTGPGLPATVRPLQAAELVEAARVPVEQQRVMVAAALDVYAAGDWIADAIALVRVLEAHSGAGCLARDDVERDADLPAVVKTRAEVGVDARADADRPNHRRRVRRDRQPVDAKVPRVRGGEDRTPRSGRKAQRACRAGESDSADGNGEDPKNTHSLHVSADHLPALKRQVHRFATAVCG